MMYELVNTSVPNGLVAGTHGFATVAMTRGLPEALRGRLEGFCAYAHRTSAHDESYWRENPVNWFHAVLPGGESVAGRVAPCDFDYTGRTNRIARLRCWKRGELPAGGAAAELLGGREWFSEGWSGEPRHLEPKAAGGGAGEVQGTAAWRRHFGERGEELAKRVARQLEKNLRAGGKTIWFRTGPRWDAGGEKLLALFAETIALLPRELRGKATFATYPASGGSGWSLRGVHGDGEKAFGAAKNAGAWVDCENGRVANEEMLPAAEEAKAASVSAAAAVAASAGAGPARAAGAEFMPRQADGSMRPRRMEGLLPRKKKGRSAAVVGVACGLGAVAAAAACLAAWRFWEDSGKESIAAEVIGQEAAVGGVPEANAPEPLAPEEAGPPKLPEPPPAVAKPEKVEEPKKEAEPAEKKEKPKEEKKKRKAEKAKEADPFDAAGDVRRGRPSKPESAKEAGGSFLVYGYAKGGGGKWEARKAEWKARKNPLGGPESIRLDVEGRAPEKLSDLFDGPLVVWVKDGVAWYDWKPFAGGRKSRIFADGKKADLRAICFGGEKKVREKWAKADGRATYRVSWDGGEIEWNAGDELKIETIAEKFAKAELEKNDREKADAEKELAELEDGKAKLREKNREAEEAIAKYAACTNRIAELEKDLKELRRRKRDAEEKRDKSKDAKARSDGKKKAEELEGEIRKLNGELQSEKNREPERKRDAGYAKTAASSGKELEEKIGEAKRKVEEIKKKRAEIVNGEENLERARDAKFAVKVEGGRDVRR